MKIYFRQILFLMLTLLFIFACDSKPRVIESEPVSSEIHSNEIPAFKQAPEVKQADAEEHKVLVEEVLHTEKYTYLNVTEKDENYWIAVSRMDAAKGDTFYYKGGLLKKDFQSREFNRVFETVYLGSNIWKLPEPGSTGSALDEALSKTEGAPAADLEVGNIKPAEGAIKISELLANKSKYGGKVVKVTGKCIKVNPMIMGRNWVHIKDSSGEENDLTVTTTENIPLGAVVSLEGTIGLDRDFGAGYRYDIIMEGAGLK